MDNTNTSLFQKTSKLEKELLSTLRKRSPNDKQVTQLRNTIRENYEKIFFHDVKFAQSKDIDQLLWKSVYYRPIEEFRKIIKKYHASAFPHPQSTPQQQQQIEKSQEKLHKTCQSFQSFLEEGNKYYDGLYKRLKQRYDYYRNSDNTKLAKIVLTSLHKNLIIQGDLARYAELYKEAQVKDWKSAQEYYLHALELLPNNGNPHNQLAVIATYQNDECEAIYRYFRSLAVSTPFVSAKENLTLLFEKNRQTYEQSVEPHLKQRKKSRNATTEEDYAVTEKRFLSEFIRLHGILFTRISMEKMPVIQSEALKDFEFLLMKGADHLDALMLKLTIMIIFTLENSRKLQSPVLQPNSASTANNVYFQHAISLGFEFLSKLVRFSAENNFQHLGAIVVFLKYLQQNKPLLQGEAATRYLQNFIEFLQILSAKNSDFHPNKISTQSAQTITLIEDVEILGFSYVEGFVSQKHSRDSSTDVAPDTALKLRVERLSAIVSNLLLDDNVKLFYDYANSIFTTVKISNRLSQPQDDETEQEEEEEEEEDQVNSFTFPEHEEQKNQFISTFGVVEEDDELDNLEEEDDLIFNNDQEVDEFNHIEKNPIQERSSLPTASNMSGSSSIMHPFGVSSNSYHPQNPATWQNASPPGNLMSQLLNKQPKQAYGSFFSNNTSFFNPQEKQSEEASGLFPPSLYQDGTWSNNISSAPNQFQRTFTPTSNGRVIEYPFQMQNQQAYNQFGGSPPPMQPSSINNGGNSNVIEAPFLAWGPPNYYQPQQQQSAQQRFNQSGNNMFIP